MAKDFIGYQALTDAALRGVVRNALRRVEKQGLIGSHHFYLTFATRHAGVDIPDFLRQQYPDEMTIILQHQFWGLKVGEETFEVTLTFKKQPATLVVPFAALTAFFDPAVQFGLQFRAEGVEQKPMVMPGALPPQAMADSGEKEKRNEKAEGADKIEKIEPPKPAATVAPDKPAAPAEVVSLDAFRKK